MAEGEFARERPLVAVAILAVVGTVAYVGVSMAFGSGPSIVEALLFAAVFTVVYMGFSALRTLLE